MLCLRSHHLFQSFKYNNLILLLSILRGAWNVTDIFHSEGLSDYVANT